MAQRELTEQEVARFSKDGVIKVHQAVESDWIPKLLAVAEQQLKKPSKWVNDVNSGASEDRLFTDRYLWRSNDVIHQFIRESGCARL
ncbi:MAG: phytanoyl-CoA dioxygenase, partial [Halieaceae bacterium]|nr:phytanoyl-CoA dioxygenase [Halieaceae bacterium]